MREKLFETVFEVHKAFIEKWKNSKQERHRDHTLIARL
jgi:hypothetical protein